MKLEGILQHLGLTEKEAKVYLALLQMGKGSVPAISLKADVKKPTTYVILDELRRKGLVTLIPRIKKVLYIAESPRKLLIEQKEREEEVAEKMPELLAIYNTLEEKPAVRFYQGKNNVGELYRKILEEKELCVYGSIAAILDELYEELEPISEKKVRKNEIKIREILQADKKSIEYAKIARPSFHEIKIAPSHMKMPTDNIIFGNKLAIFSYKSEPMTVVIESSDVVETYRSMFEVVWGSIK